MDPQYDMIYYTKQFLQLKNIYCLFPEQKSKVSISVADIINNVRKKLQIGSNEVK